MQENRHAHALDEGPVPRSVTRRDALRLLFGAGASAIGASAASLALGPARALGVTTQQKLDDAQARYDEVEAELDRIGEEYAELNRQNEETLAQIEEVSGRVAAKEAEIEAKQAEIDEKQAQIEEKQAEIEEKQAEIEAKERELQRKQEHLAARMSSSYKSGKQGMLDLLLSATSFEEFTSSIYYLDKITQADEQMIEDIRQMKAELEQEKAELEQEKADLEVQKAELEDEKADLEVQKAELEDEKAELEALQAQQAAQLQEITAKQAEVEETLADLDDEVQDLIAQRDAEILAAQEEARRVAAANAASGGGGGAVVTWSEGFSGSQAAVVNAASWTPSAGVGFCAAWVSNVFAYAGVGSFRGNACDMYWWYCSSSDVNAIKPGMIIAVPTEPYSYAAIIYGHVGIYIGNNTVRHCASGVVMSESLSSWISRFGVTSTPRWGWLGGVVLG